MSSWEPVSLAGLPERDPVRPDLGGVGFVYPGLRHLFSGPFESGKTLVAYCVALRVARTGGRVILIDHEMGRWDARDRLRDLGASNAEIEQVLYVEPEEAATDWDIRRLVEMQPTLVLIDAAAGAYDLYGLDDERRKDVEALNRQLIKPFWHNGIATIALDHVTKSESDRRYAIGSERKITGLDVHLGITATTKLVRGGQGTYTITRRKDRVGHLPLTVPVAVLHVTSDPVTGRMDWHFALPAQPNGRAELAVYIERVSEYLATNAPTRRTAIYKAVTGKQESLVAAVSALIREGYATHNADGEVELLKPFTDDVPPVPAPAPADQPGQVPGLPTGSSEVPGRSHPVPNPNVTTVPTSPPPAGGRGGERPPALMDETGINRAAPTLRTPGWGTS